MTILIGYQAANFAVVATDLLTHQQNGEYAKRVLGDKLLKSGIEPNLHLAFAGGMLENEQTALRRYVTLDELLGFPLDELVDSTHFRVTTLALDTRKHQIYYGSQDTRLQELDIGHTLYIGLGSEKYFKKTLEALASNDQSPDPLITATRLKNIIKDIESEETLAMGYAIYVSDENGFRCAYRKVSLKERAIAAWLNAFRRKTDMTRYTTRDDSKSKNRDPVLK